MEQATQRMLVMASPERCFDVATDFLSYSEWSNSVKEVAVVATDDAGRATQVRFSGEALNYKTTFVLAYDYREAPRRLAWSLVDGDIERSLDGEYVFEADGEGTQCTYVMAVDLRIPLPGFLKRKVEKKILSAGLQELKERAES